MAGLWVDHPATVRTNYQKVVLNLAKFVQKQLDTHGPECQFDDLGVVEDFLNYAAEKHIDQYVLGLPCGLIFQRETVWLIDVVTHFHSW